MFWGERVAHVAGPQHIKVRVIGSYLDPNDNGTHIPYHNYSFFHVVAKFAVMRCLEESGQKACKMLIEPIWYWLVASFKSSQVKIILHVFKSANFFFFADFRGLGFLLVFCVDGELQPVLRPRPQIRPRRRSTRLTSLRRP